MSVSFAYSSHCCLCSTSCMHVGGPWMCSRHSGPYYGTPGQYYIPSTTTTAATTTFYSPPAYVGRHRKGDPED